MPRRGPDEPIRAGTADMLMSRASAVRRRLGNLEKVSMEYIEASGDCFYLALESALSEQDGWCPYFAVSTMRDVVASRMTEETYQMYSLMYQQQAEGFKFMQGIEDLESLRKLIRLRGSKVGAGKCVWADGFAMETIATHYQLLLLIVDERSSQKFTRVSPQQLEWSEDGNPGPSSHGGTVAISASQPVVLLHSSQREHMNLILYDGRRIQLLGNLPLELQKLCPEEESPAVSRAKADTLV